MKSWLLAFILIIPAVALGEAPEGADPEDSIAGWEASGPPDPNTPSGNWMDSSHSYATARAQALTEWMDSFFGDPTYELEQPESLLRLDLINDWDEEEGTKYNARLRGKLQLPALSKRLNLVFNDESGDGIDTGDGDRKVDDAVGLLYELSEGKNSRVDLTMGISWNHLRPGIRYRYRGYLSSVSNYLFTQRLQYETGEGFYETTQIQLNRILGENTILRWNNRAIYGQETDGVEWRTRLSLFQRHKTINRRHELGISYFGSISGVTDPEDYVKNYKLGVLFRRRVFRDFLFLELEPAYNYRKRNPDENRQFAWSIGLTLQIALERDLERSGRNNKDPEATGAKASALQSPATEQETGSRQQSAADSLTASGDL